MATIPESEAAFNARATEHGLTRAQLQRLQDQGLTNLSKLAFAVTTPGTVPGDDALRGLLSDNPDEVTIGHLSSIRRLMFDAQTLCASQIKSTLSGSDVGRKAELVPAERATRIQNQKTRLQGMELTGPMECSHSSYDYVAKMLEADVPMYLEPHRFTTRASEVSREKPGKELVLDNVNLLVKDAERRDKCQISNELQLHQAFTRRSLACDLMQVCTFRHMERWHRHLLDQLQNPSPPGYRQPTVEQIMRADRAGWIKMSEKVLSLKRGADGALPLDAALDALQADPAVMFHLMPLPVDKHATTAKTSETAQNDSGGGKPLRVRKTDKSGKGKGKGKGKQKSKPSSKGKMPTELIGLHQQTKSGKRMCYNFNLERGCDLAPAGGEWTAGLTAEVRKLGCQHGTGVDAHVTKQVKAPVIRIDLATAAGQELLWRILQQPRVFGVHLSPPCGTSSRAREIHRRSGFNPPPLRSDAHPDGLPHLTSKDRARVQTANILYRLTAEILVYCTLNGILCSVENPARSLMWQTSHWQGPVHPYKHLLQEVLFHHCAFGATRRKRTKLVVNHACYAHLNKDCDNSHPHEGWGYTPKGWATALEVEYPHGLCKEWAACLRQALLHHGAVEVPLDMQSDTDASLHLRAKAAVGSHVRGKRLKPLMKEYSYVVTIDGPQDPICQLPKLVATATVLSPLCTASPPIFLLPAHAKQLRAPILLGDSAGQRNLWRVEYGISWEPQSFVNRAAGLSHPGHFLDGVHEVLASLFSKMTTESLHSLAQERTAAMRKWVARLAELKSQKLDGLEASPEHAKKILRNKNLQLFGELVEASGSPDKFIARDIAKGFELMGPIPAGGIYPSKPLHATLLPEQVREMAGLARDATWSAVKRSRNNELCQEIYDSAVEECQRGWMRGPYTFDELPERSVLTRRFGVQQTSTLADGSRTLKFRPIDDFSESLVNVTNSCEETIQPMGVDQLSAALVKRMRIRPGDQLRCKTIDLRKAYKNLPIAESSLDDAYICVFSPKVKEPLAFQTLVLPFGARAAVMGFCRTSYAIWRIGVVLFNLHWTVYFDDFFLVAEVHECGHVDLAQRLLFMITGWQTSDEKEGGFSSVSRILGVQIDLADSHLGTAVICNVKSRVEELSATIDAILKKGQDHLFGDAHPKRKTGLCRGTDFRKTHRHSHEAALQT
eukprot:s1805_g3.t1